MLLLENRHAPVTADKSCVKHSLPKYAWKPFGVFVSKFAAKSHIAIPIPACCIDLSS